MLLSNDSQTLSRSQSDELSHICSRKYLFSRLVICSAVLFQLFKLGGKPIERWKNAHWAAFLDTWNKHFMWETTMALSHALPQISQVLVQ